MATETPESRDVRTQIAESLGVLHPRRGRARVASALSKRGEQPLDVLVVEASMVADRLSDVVRALDPGGYVYVMGGRRSRNAVERLAQRGLTPLGDIAELPPGGRRLLVPVSRRSLDWASRSGLVFRARRDALALSVLPLAPRLGRLVLPIGTLLGGAEAVPPGDDLTDLTGGSPFGPLAIPLASGHRGRVVALAVEGAVPAVITVGTGAGAVPLKCEEVVLTTIAADAGAAGASVPRLMGGRSGHGWRANVQSMVDGTLAATAINRSPGSLRTVVGSVGAWIRQWHERTSVSMPLGAETAAAELLDPCTRLGAVLAPGYCEWLQSLVRRAEGGSVTLADAHGDLTMANILVGDQAIGVIDWVSAVSGRIALQDLIYACCDAVGAVHAYSDRLGAFEASFRPAGPYAGLVADVVGAAARDVSPWTRQLAFHACWLRHASWEIESGETDGPFASIAACLSRDPEGYAA